MDNSESPQLNNIEVSATNTMPEAVERPTLRLLPELQDLNFEAATMMNGGPAPIGSRSAPLAIGSIALEILPVIPPRVIGPVKTSAPQCEVRIVQFKGGK